MSEAEGETVHSGKFLAYRRTEGGWEYVSRCNVKGCVAVLAVTEDKRVILTEQFRPPVGRRVIELPAGLAGDIPLQEDEPLVVAAKRELKEEAGYEAKNWLMLTEGTSSAGMTDELVTIFHATGLTKVNEGGGVGGEDIKIHYVNQMDVPKWCRDRQSRGLMVDFKIFAALYLARALHQSTESRLWF
ncbi:MAG: NUDIX hydrolase [Verrucomicrobiales bacterium]